MKVKIEYTDEHVEVFINDQVYEFEPLMATETIVDHIEAILIQTVEDVYIEIVDTNNEDEW